MFRKLVNRMEYNRGIHSGNNQLYNRGIFWPEGENFWQIRIKKTTSICWENKKRDIWLRNCKLPFQHISSHDGYTKYSNHNVMFIMYIMFATQGSQKFPYGSHILWIFPLLLFFFSYSVGFFFLLQDCPKLLELGPNSKVCLKYCLTKNKDILFEERSGF